MNFIGILTPPNNQSLLTFDILYSKIHFLFFQESFSEQCKKEGKKIYHEPETFHIGSDKIIHFTETHLKNKYTDFCVDMSMDINLKSSLQYDDRSGGGEEYNYVYDDNSTSYSGEYYNDDGDYDEAVDEMRQDFNETGCMADDDDSFEDTTHQMIAVFCDYEFIEIRKCCDKNHNLNLRYVITNMILH